MKKLLLTLGIASTGLAPISAVGFNSMQSTPKVNEYTLPEKAVLTSYKKTTIDAYKNQLISILSKFVTSDNKKIDTSTISDSKTIDEAVFAFNEIKYGNLKNPDVIIKAKPDKPKLPAFDKWDTISPEYTKFVSNIKSLFDGLLDGTAFNYWRFDNRKQQEWEFNKGINELVNQAKNGNGNLPTAKLAALENLKITNNYWGWAAKEAAIHNIIISAKLLKVPVDLTGRISWLDDDYSMEKTLAEVIRLIRLEFPEFDPDDVRGKKGNGWDFEMFLYDRSDGWKEGIKAAKALTNGFAASRTNMDTSTITGDTPTIVKANAKLLAVDHSDNLGSDASHIDVDSVSSPAATLYTTSTFNLVKQSYIEVISNPIIIDGEDGENIDTRPFVNSTTLAELDAAWDAIDFHLKFVGFIANIHTPDKPVKDYIEQSKLVEWVNEIKYAFYKIKDNTKVKTFFTNLDKLSENEDNDQALIDSIQKISEDFLEIAN